MRGFVTNIEKETLANENFRQVLYTAANSQLVLMSLKPGEEIGAETHELDQFFRFEQGAGKVVLNGVEQEVSDGVAVIVPAGTEHNVINTSPDQPLKLYTIYSPPEHKDKISHPTKADALADTTDHYDGVTSVQS